MKNNLSKIIGRLTLVLLLSSILSGCMSIAGTIAEEKRSKIYIGTRTDIEMATPPIFHWPANIPFAIISLPFDFAFDTLFLPYTIYHEVQRRPTGLEDPNESKTELKGP